MDADIAMALPITATLGGETRTFPRLTVRQLHALKLSVDGLAPKEQLLMSLREFGSWASHDPLGAVCVLAMSSGKPEAEVETWGSIPQRARVATDVYMQSILNGEENIEPPKPQAGQSPG